LNDDDWQEQAMHHPHGGGAGGAVQAVCYCDSTRELRGMIEQCWEEFEAGFEDSVLAGTGQAETLGREHTGLRIDIDSGFEVSLGLFPVVSGQLDAPLVAHQVLLQLHDDGAGSPDPALLQELLEWLLEDLLPRVRHVDFGQVAERFAGGERPLLLTDTSGRLLEMPPAMTDFN
jgi:hypothetical protein